MYRERGASTARALVFERGELIDRREADGVATLLSMPNRRPPSLHERQTVFDAATCDRLRVLATELRRVADQGGEVLIRLFRHAAAMRGHRLERAVDSVMRLSG